MANFNKVMLMGNLTRDPEVRYTPKGTAVAKIGLAINRVWTSETGERKEEVTFVDIDLWSRNAEIAQQYLHKGSPLFVEGRLQLDTWDDKQTGQKRSKMKVVGERIQLIGAPRGSAEFKEQPAGEEHPAPARPARPAAPPPPAPEEEPPASGEADNIPF